MATGDQADAEARVKRLLPRWFGIDPTTVLDALLQAYAWSISYIYGLIQYAALQTRIATATDGWLDLVAYDFFGDRIVRAAGQTDASFRVTIIAEIFRERATRHAVTAILTTLTGRAPKIIEPWRPTDTGAMNVNGVLAYGAVGCYGSRTVPYMGFVIAYRGNGVSDSQIYAAVASVKPAGTALWVQIQN